MPEQAPEPPAPAKDGSGQTPGSAQPQPPPEAVSAPPTGRRVALRDIRRQLTNDDLASPGVQKLLLDELERADADCEVMEGYVERFHEADKRAAVLEERVRTATAIEILFGVGVGLGGAIMGVSPLLWDRQPQGWIALSLGFLLTLGATIARMVKR